MATQALPHGDSAGTILGHPKGLFVLFFAEMWERFSYYGMRALLIFYLTKHWLFSDSEAGIIYGAYTALVYITPAVGGYMADKVLGQRKAVAFGAVLLTLGHFFMAFEGEPAAGNADNPVIYVFWLALALIIVGSGFLKANISVLVGQLYPRTDVRRDGAYTIFYMGINLGAAAGSLLCGYIGETYGWAYGFGLAGIGMLACLLVFTLGKVLLLGRGEPPKALAKGTEWGMYGIGFVLVAVCLALIQSRGAVGWRLQPANEDGGAEGGVRTYRLEVIRHERATGGGPERVRTVTAARILADNQLANVRTIRVEGLRNAQTSRRR